MKIKLLIFKKLGNLQGKNLKSLLASLILLKILENKGFLWEEVVLLRNQTLCRILRDLLISNLRLLRKFACKIRKQIVIILSNWYKDLWIHQIRTKIIMIMF